MANAISNLLHILGFGRMRAYRPELHYMRGPGPKSRERSACGRIARH